MPSISLPWADFLYNVSNVAIVIGAALVLLGTIGTVSLSAVRDWYGDQRLKANEARTAEANQAAGDANERAGVANREAGRANERAAQLEKEAAELRLTVEQERVKRLSLEKDIGDMKPQVQSLMPLRLNSEQINAIAKFGPSSPSGKINIILDVAASLMKSYADDLEQAFSKAGWSVLRAQAMGVGFRPKSGIALGYFNGGPSDNQKAATRAFGAAELAFDTYSIGDRPQNQPLGQLYSPQMAGYGPDDVRITITSPVQ